jgi:hypothetical protein
LLPGHAAAQVEDRFEALGGAPCLQDRFLTSDDLLHAGVHPCERVAGNFADCPRAIGIYWLESHRWLLSWPVPGAAAVARRKGTSSGRLEWSLGAWDA